MAEKWRKDKTIPLVDVVESFNVFIGNHGTEPNGTPTKAQLEDAFESTSDVVAIQKILEDGEILAPLKNTDNWRRTRTGMQGHMESKNLQPLSTHHK